MEHWQVLPPLSQLQETDKRCVMLTVTEFDHVQGYKLILRRVSDSRQSWCNLLGLASSFEQWVKRDKFPSTLELGCMCGDCLLTEEKEKAGRQRKQCAAMAVL